MLQLTCFSKFKCAQTVQQKTKLKMTIPEPVGRATNCIDLRFVHNGGDVTTGILDVTNSFPCQPPCCSSNYNNILRPCINQPLSLAHGPDCKEQFTKPSETPRQPVWNANTSSCNVFNIRNLKNPLSNSHTNRHQEAEQGRRRKGALQPTEQRCTGTENERYFAPWEPKHHGYRHHLNQTVNETLISTSITAYNTIAQSSNLSSSATNREFALWKPQQCHIARSYPRLRNLDEGFNLPRDEMLEAGEAKAVARHELEHRIMSCSPSNLRSPNSRMFVSELGMSTQNRRAIGSVTQFGGFIGPPPWNPASCRCVWVGHLEVRIKHFELWFRFESDFNFLLTQPTTGFWISYLLYKKLFCVELNYFLLWMTKFK